MNTFKYLGRLLNAVNGNKSSKWSLIYFLITLDPYLTFTHFSLTSNYCIQNVHKCLCCIFLTQNVCNTINILTELTLVAKINWFQKAVLNSIILSSNLIFSSTLLGMNPHHRHHLKAFLPCDYNCNCGISFVISKFSIHLFPLELTWGARAYASSNQTRTGRPSGRHSRTLLHAAKFILYHSIKG